MRVYVSATTTAEDVFLGEVFVNENDAKKWVADQNSQLTEEEREKVYHGYTPRQLRTSWNG